MACCKRDNRLDAAASTVTVQAFFYQGFDILSERIAAIQEITVKPKYSLLPSSQLSPFTHATAPRLSSINLTAVAASLATEMSE